MVRITHHIELLYDEKSIPVYLNSFRSIIRRENPPIRIATTDVNPIIANGCPASIHLIVNESPDYDPFS
jgi:hypothetical protein